MDIFIHDVKSVFLCYIHILKLLWNSDNSSIQNIHKLSYMDSAMLSYSYPFEDQCFPFSSLKWVNNWCCYENIRKQYYTMQIICLSSFLKQTTYETISEGIKFLLNLTFYNRCLCKKLLLSHLYLPFYLKKLSPYE